MSRTVLVAIGCVLFACSSGGGSGKSPEVKSSPEAAPPEPAEPAQPVEGSERVGLVRDEPLPPLVAKVMRKQMGRHAQRMEGLQWSALMLNYESTLSISSQIASEPRIARPSAGEDTINKYVPTEFYDLQDELHASAGELAKASEAKDDGAMIDAYGRLTKTCISCHSLYLSIPGASAAPAETTD